ncbi:hypothetical protein [Pseudomonas sp. TH10]|uniref:hypothetical protein n=1 Tax=Pseudomonas sp. TH10 TaxID=2796376 RepID=UPI001F5B8C1E|nr:hypothetical protein [Pseudomonas sp. TH10]
MNKVIALGQGLALLACAIALPLHAAVQADQAQRLKGDLTPTGAEKGEMPTARFPHGPVD